MRGAIVVLYLLLAIVGGVLGYLAFDTRSDVGEVRRIVTQACQVDPNSDECQAVFSGAIRNFNRETVCILARKLGQPCERRRGRVTQGRPSNEGANDETGTTPSNGGTNGPSTDGGSGAPSDPADGAGADPPSSSPPEPSPPASPDPVAPPPPPSDPPAAPSPAEPGGIGGTGIDPELPVLGGTCDLAPVLCP